MSQGALWILYWEVHGYIDYGSILSEISKKYYGKGIQGTISRKCSIVINLYEMLLYSIKS